MHLFKALWSFCFLLLTASCGFFGAEEDPVVAEVGDKKLYASELRSLVPARAASKDSAEIIARFVETWINKQLLMAAAEQSPEVDDAEIDRRVEDYRYQILLYEFEKNYVLRNLDTLVTEEQVKKYYEEHKEDFLLKDNIIRGIFVKVPKEAPQSSQLARLLQSNHAEMSEEVRSYATTYADEYVIDTLWHNFNELTLNTPFREEILNPAQVLRSRNLLQTSDSAHVYCIRVLDYKVSDQVSPLEFVRRQIIEIILNQRKIALRQQLEDSVVTSATPGRDYQKNLKAMPQP